jgi:TorA maturation chaperone TorD
MAEQISEGQFYFFFKNYMDSNNHQEKILQGFLSDKSPSLILKELDEEYYRLFSEFGKERISMVESYYKQWTMDPECSISFAKEKGFLMGDSAIHLLDLFSYFGLETDDSFKGMPDHLLVELEFLSYLYKIREERFIKSFIKDHLDWIPQLKKGIIKSNPHPFYRSAIEILDLFLGLEKERLEVEKYE